MQLREHERQVDGDELVNLSRHGERLEQLLHALKQQPRELPIRRAARLMREAIGGHPTQSQAIRGESSPSEAISVARLVEQAAQQRGQRGGARSELQQLEHHQID